MNYLELKETDFTEIQSQGKFLPTLLELVNKNNFDALIFSEPDNSFCCLLPVSDFNSPLPQMSGLLIEYQNYKKVGASVPDKYIMIKCSHKSYLQNFVLILKEILSVYDTTHIELSKSLTLVISKWRHFLSAPKISILNEDEIVGLIGELIFIEYILTNVDVQLLKNWTADRGEEDFIHKNTIIEIKTTRKEKHEHIINGIDQLLLSQTKVKYILSILLNQGENNNDISLPNLINSCVNQIAHEPELLDLFYQKLRLRKYDIRDSLLYEQYKYLIHRTGMFQVNEDFPKLTTKELQRPLNTRISKVRYLVDMEGLQNTDMFLVDYQKLFNL
jgi:hypothetical protein